MELVTIATNQIYFPFHNENCNLVAMGNGSILCLHWFTWRGLSTFRKWEVHLESEMFCFFPLVDYSQKRPKDLNTEINGSF